MTKRWQRVIGCTALLVAIATPASADDKSVSPYAATPDSVVSAMLSLASVGPRDYVIDLGSGDGRLVIAAAKEHGARGLGVDIDAKLVEIANNLAARDGVTDRVEFKLQDLFETDLSKATVITIYLLPSIMGRVADKLRNELRPGTRVVVHDFPLPGWRADRVHAFDVPEKRDYTFNERATLYLYTVSQRR
ncbi:MAG TPA: methyltransferase domain-containing protein [Casimicrobiaceae bacterium]|nr:methyltransferase domain-containing protein [Casimicrobiaceae bacterium]